MKNGLTHEGTVVPMVTPITARGDLDEPAVDRLVESLIEGGVKGVFVLGTTGEGANVPKPLRRQMIRRTAASVRGRATVYAGLGDLREAEFGGANDCFADGANAVVVHPPISESVPAPMVGTWYWRLLDALKGPLILYNMPSTTGLSIPLDAVESLMGHPNLAGIKDSENNAKRLEELLKRVGGRAGFSVFVGVGALMEKGLKLGANGIVPSVGNLIPDVCQSLCASAGRGDWVEAETHFSRMNAVAALYQKGRTLNESLSVLKAAVHFRGLCEPYVFPPLNMLSAAAMEKLRNQMVLLELRDNGNGNAKGNGNHGAGARSGNGRGSESIHTRSK